jgi:hypothetical protein
MKLFVLFSRSYGIDWVCVYFAAVVLSFCCFSQESEFLKIFGSDNQHLAFDEEMPHEGHEDDQEDFDMAAEDDEQVAADGGARANASSRRSKVVEKETKPAPKIEPGEHMDLSVPTPTCLCNADLFD